MPHVPKPRPRTVVRLSAWLILLGWAGFWVFFTLGEIASTGPAGLAHVVFPLIPMAALLLFTRRRPRLGSVLLLAFGVGTAFMFQNAYALGLFSAPPIVAGLGILATSPRPRLMRRPGRRPKQDELLRSAAPMAHDEPAHEAQAPEQHDA